MRTNSNFIGKHNNLIKRGEKSNNHKNEKKRENGNFFSIFLKMIFVSFRLAGYIYLVLIKIEKKKREK